LYFRLLCLSLVFATALAGASTPARAEYELQPVYPNLTFTSPTDIQPANDGSYRTFVVEKSGLIWVFEADYQVTTKSVFLDIQDRVRNVAEAGLLGLAFHPDYASNGQFFVFYITKVPSRTIVARFNVTADPNVADKASEFVLLDFPQSTAYHNGGQLAFGADGMLYIARGDDRYGPSAQDLTDLFGSILRIDVDVTPPPDGSAAPTYEIPPDNPYAGNQAGYCEEIFAQGFRNPWRFSIDALTGELWVADVGENTYEELNVVEKGRNYGWPYMEGPACFAPASCDTAGRDIEAPLYAYTHGEGVAVIGGYRYWGTRLPELAGLYLFSDYTGGKVWGLHFDGAGPPERFDLVTGAPILLTFGLGFRNEILMASSNGRIYQLGRVVTAAGAAPAAGPRLLGNFPNPFNPSTTIRYRLEDRADVRLEIASVDGALVRHLESGSRGAGEHRVAWSGENDAGGRVASGVYFARLIVDGVAVGAARLVLVQ
jgi:glucose/arabinose dehydrogenase